MKTVAQLNAARKHPKRPNIYRISGENVTLTEIAERLGVSVSTASNRLHREKQMPGATTWERLAK